MRWIDTGTTFRTGSAFVRALPDNRIHDCLFSLWITGEPLSCEIVTADRGWRKTFRFGPPIQPDYKEYLFRYLLKEARGSDHDFRFTWLIGFKEIFDYFDRHRELLKHRLLVPIIKDAFGDDFYFEEKKGIEPGHARMLFGYAKIPDSVRTEIERVTKCRFLSGR